MPAATSWKKPRKRCVAGLVPAFASLWCCTGPADVPAVPDLSSLDAEYDDPTAQLPEADAVRKALEGFPALQRLAAAFQSTQRLIGSAEDATDEADPGDLEGVRVRGGLKITLDCPGDENDAGEAGTFSLDLAVSDSTVRGSFWGLADHCAFGTSVNGVLLHAELDGDVAVDLGESIPLGGAWPQERLLLSVVGAITLSDTTLGQATFQGLSARFIGDRFEYLLTDGDGTLILFATASGLGVRDATQTWFCGTDYTGCAAQ